MKLLSKALVALLQLALILTVILVPDNKDQAVTSKTLYLAILGLGLLYYLGLWLLNSYSAKIANEKFQSSGDLVAVITGAIFLWEISCTKLALLDPNLFPGPAKVLAALLADQKVLLTSVWSSVKILLIGYGAAVLLAIPLGLYVGWRKRLYRTVQPLAKIISPVPPTVYVPYAITLLPSFFLSSVFVIFIGAFWPVFINTLNGVFTIDYRLIESARSLGVKNTKLLFRVLLPGAAPSIFSGAMVGLVLSFIMLTIAEMIGATSGLGWYIQYFADFYKFDHVLAGMLVISALVSIVVLIFDRVQTYCLRWQRRSDLA